ncbi:Aste57867_11383 [Aphanomyces stellatus]|uniref:Aste57867_11383 protein n=1 Tax=Aphanomyces stellatus TaxID=120398 RepID=A0A485KST4_9STRA|nr:hypothetical protein As57867_011341 [Aphanomyces stellatus]VFT88244.1 Aste57867_11383 [Aphanomyces stellatus]
MEERPSHVAEDDMVLLEQVLSERGLLNQSTLSVSSSSSSASPTSDRLSKLDWNWASARRMSMSDAKDVAKDAKMDCGQSSSQESTKDSDTNERMHLTHPTLSMLQSDSISSLDCYPQGKAQSGTTLSEAKPEEEFDEDDDDPVGRASEAIPVDAIRDSAIDDMMMRPSSLDPLAPPKFVVRKGWIEKCGGTFKTWKWRYFELTRDGWLRYYTAEDKAVLKGAIHVEKTTANDIVIQTHVSTREFFFILVTPQRNYLFSTNTERSMRRWIRGLENIGAQASTGRWDPLRNTVHLTVDESKQAHKWKGYDDPHDGKTTMAGILLKRGHLRTNWVQRYFKIEVVDQHPILRYYADDKTTPKGSISLVNTYLSPGTPFCPDGRRNYFMLHCGAHELHLNALSEPDMRRWIHALAKTIVMRPLPSMVFPEIAAQAAHVAAQLSHVTVTFQTKDDFETLQLEGRAEALIVSQTSILFATIPLGAQLIRVDNVSIGLTLDVARLRLAQATYPMTCEFICAPAKRGTMVKKSRSNRPLASWKSRDVLIEHGFLSYFSWHELRDSFPLAGCYLQLADSPSRPFCVAVGRSPADKLVLQASSKEEQIDWAATLHCGILMASQGLKVEGLETQTPFFV